MYKTLFRTPLQQAMLALWVFGLARLFASLGKAPPNGEWVLAAGIAAVVLALIGARYRMLAVLPLSIILALCAFIAGGYALGVDYPMQLGALVAVFGLSLWRVTLSLRDWPQLGQSVNALGLGGRYRAPGGRWWAERYVYWSSFALVMLGFGVDLLKGVQAPAVPAVTWPVLLSATVFLLVSGHHYRRALNTYLSLVVLCFAAVSGLLAVRSASQMAGGTALPLDDLTLGLIFVWVSAFAMGVARLCEGRDVECREASADLKALYARPLRHVSAGLALLALTQVLGLSLVSAPLSGWMATAILLFAAAILFCVNRHLLHPALTAVAALVAAFGFLWLFNGMVYGRPLSGMWPGSADRGGDWLVLALLVSALAVSGYWFQNRPHLRREFGIPLGLVAGLAFGWALIGAVSLYPTGSVYLPWVIAALVAALFPLLRPLRHGAALRGLGVALLLTFLVAAVVGFEGRGELGIPVTLGWGFVLWGLGTLVLPRLNVVLRHWAVTPETWPWLGLVVLVGGLLAAYQPGVAHWGLGLTAAVYFFLMLRHSRWPGFAWLGVAALTLGVVLLGIDYVFLASSGSDLQAIGLFAFENLLWANLLLAGIPVWRRHGPAVSLRLGWREPSLRGPLLCTAFTVCVAWLVGLLFFDGLRIFLGTGFFPDHGAGILLGVFLSLSLLHAHAHWPRTLSAHLLIAALVTTLLSAWVSWQPFHLPLAVVIIGVLLTLGYGLTSCTGAALIQSMRKALRMWTRIVPVVGVACLLLVFEIPLYEQLIAVGLLAGVAAFAGWQEQSRLWICLGLAFAALLLHGIWLLWIPWVHILWLLPLYALQFALVGGGLRWLSPSVLSAADGSTTSRFGTPFVSRLLTDLFRAAIVLGLVEWGGHLLLTVLRVLADRPLSDISGWMGDAATIATGILLAAVSLSEGARTRYERYWYLAAGLFALTALYGRILWFGLAPISVWDTAAIIAAAYAMFALQYLTGSRAAWRLNMILPLAALLTVPAQLNSAGGTMSLFAVGALYLLTRRTSGRATPLYLGLLSINAGIYLWVPDWARHFGLIQVYVIPAALSVLLLVHLHRAELRSHVVSGARLAALSTLFGAATLDVFLQENLGIFVLALALSLAGVIVGIVTRTRAFLYAGLAFLVINVLGQLLQLYPEQRLGRALLLMVLGAAITAAMIWFNLKREAIMQRLRLVRADLATWE